MKEYDVNTKMEILDAMKDAGIDTTPYEKLPADIVDGETKEATLAIWKSAELIVYYNYQGASRIADMKNGKFYKIGF